ncbi:MAG TPA: type II toxin-antitoxin system PemK/MazF family toxin [Candidatus Baltobacteraceae bacterium]|nr:type II toxin-antitoxin system PemK/MazF family toxin [Candidatus Baltobacteraceae bacterium]
MSVNAHPDRGDIVWIDFDPHGGHEHGKRRPALVLSSGRYNARSGLALICPISSRAKGLRFEVPLDETGETCGVVLADHIHSFDWRARRIEFRERAPQNVLDEVLARVAALLEF